ncbi:MAG: DUF1616 domain-containing protein [Candidatus Thermoplasmatota archaeon]|nr:DUF1616 domain-containing protein [Candidatus Thermoplasmatota archaeon]MBS3790018.1 DUF1616 domain-containing protein [Candidatus Thermoplasmatota archaeon]
MKIRIKEKPWDLLIVALLTSLLILAVALTPESIWRTILGLPFILFLPGYVLISFLFPEDEPLDHIERIALSFGLSIAITPLIGLALNYIWEISLVPILYSQSLFIYTFSLLAYLRRRSIPTEELFSIEFEINPPDWENYDWIDKALVIATVGLLIASGGLAYHIATTPRTGERFTELYILGQNGTADHYPRNLMVNENGTVIVGVVNREHETVNYTLGIGLGDAEENYENMERLSDIPENYTFSLPSNNTYRFTELRLSHGEKWNQMVNFSIEQPREEHYKVSFFLLRDGEIYQNPVHLWIKVGED